ncbi:MAG: high-potential iron-sulfur protein [Sandaracinus sp.]|nr:high-potential iron-sulfur protein [Sandaracinus sp.]MCB9634676.1 high-potential iron-sulfur protein [Sandaracinus sp.]
MKRRDLLRTVISLPVVAAAGSVLQACGGGESELSCNDTSGVPPAAQQMRTTLAYVEHSPHGAQKNCTNCNFFQAAAAGQCGGCTLIQGPIHPEGYCNSWAAKA